MTDGNARSLAQIHLLEDLSAVEIERLEQACSWKTYAAQEQIIDRQSDTQDVYFVVTGAARVVIYSLSGREITLDDVNAGGHFGDLAAIDGEPRSASVMALRDTVIASLSQERFLQLLSEHFTVTLRLMRALTRIVRTSTDRIMDLSTLAANNRVQADLLRLARNNMVGENRAELKPIPVHGDIASRVSTTRETVARVLSDLSRQGMVERQKDRLVIDNVDRLEDMVEEVRGE
ncbi:Crp/Fnr family transcriptional regulator [bacterium SCSIO 12827]|nr:Crp/Fnr family transcriptional regulator [bacterium SCSIO 12827]